ncbi:hypothetical protein [Paenibacillus aestuarii]|uniref:Uncharacterized protein n=1 Tax=Paenibacillus aestuarii TaxID=516965 RepID=A0ABW0KIE3_9BACL|nr:hypothetical protein [Paenibacillus aestuarii]
MIYGTKLLESDIELFTAALTQAPVFVWSLDQVGVYYQADTGYIVKYTADYVQIYSNQGADGSKSVIYSRDTNEFSLR